MCEIEKSLCEIGKSLREISKSLYEKLRDHNYQSRMQNCHVRFILTVDNEKSLCEKKKSPFEIIDWFFSEPVRQNQSAESSLAGFSLILKMAEQLSAVDFTEFIDSLTSIVKRTASVYIVHLIIQD